MNLKKKIALILSVILVIAALFAVMMISSSAAAGDVTVNIDGKDYTIKAADIVSDAKMAVFAKGPEDTEYTFVCTYSQFMDKFSVCKDTLNNSYAGGEVYLYALGDIEETRESGWNFGYEVNGTMIIDFGGHTFINEKAPRLIGFLSNAATSSNVAEFTSKFVIKNGTFSTSKYIARIWAESEAYAGEKKVEISFEDITFAGFGSNYTIFPSEVPGSVTYTENMKATFDINFTNCIFNAPSTHLTVASDANPEGTVATRVYLDSCVYNLSRFDASNETGGTAAAGKMSAEDKTTVRFKDYGVELTESYADGSTLHFTYDRKFFLLGQKAGSDSYTFISKYGSSKTAIDTARSQLQGNTYKGGTVVVLMPFANLEDGSDDIFSNSGSGWNECMKYSGTLMLDLGGHTFTATAPRAFGFLAGNNKSGTSFVNTADSAVKVVNGTFKTDKVISEIWSELTGNFYGTEAAPATRNCSLIFENVTFTPNSASLASYTMFNGKTSANTNFSSVMRATYNVTLNNCTFNYPNTKLTIASDTNAEGSVAFNVEINGGTVISNDITKFTPMANKQSDDSIVFSGTKFQLPYSDTVYTTEFPTASGNMKLVPQKVSTSSTATITYILSATEIEGYGLIPDDYKNKPFLLFKGNLFLDSSNDYYNAMAKARNYLHYTDGAFRGSEISVLMNTDSFTDANAAFNAICEANGTITLDLGGGTLTTSGAMRLIGFLMSDNYPGSDGTEGYDTTFVMKNGTYTSTNNRPVAELWVEKSNKGPLYTGNKNCFLKFDGVTFNATSDSYTMFNAKTSSSANFSESMTAVFDIDINNCTLNYPETSSLTIVNDAHAAGTVDTDLTITNGAIYTKDITKLATLNGKQSEDSVLFSTGTKFYLPYSDKAPTVTFPTTDGEMHISSYSVSNKGTIEHRLTNTQAGNGYYIPAAAANLNYILFINDVYMFAHNEFQRENNNNCIMKTVRSFMDANSGIFKGEELTILVNKDNLTSAESYSNLAQIDGTLVIDLNNKVFTKSGKTMFDAVGKTHSGTLNETKVKVKNGTILTNGVSVINISAPGGSANFNYEGTKNYGFTFENVTFGKAEGATAYTNVIGSHGFTNNNGTSRIHVAAEFKNCHFTSADGILFNFSASDLLTSDVKINGGTITTDSLANNDVQVGTKGNNKLTFGKVGEEYVTLKMPAGAAAPSAVFNGGTLNFVKISEENGIAIYTLRAGLSGYRPKTSIVLDSSLYMNVYVPVELTNSFILAGVEYTDLEALESNKFTSAEGVEYFRIPVMLNSYEALEDIVLKTTVNYGDKTAVGTFAFSLSTYSKKIIDGEGSEVEKTLLKNVLSYVRAAYAYFPEADKTKIAAVDAIIGTDYDASNLPTIEGSTEAPTNGLSGVTFILSATPTIRFYISDTTKEYKFFIGETELKTVTGTDAEGAYIDMDVYAYAMCETITYTIDGEKAGSYHINAYYNFVTNHDEYKNNENLINLVLRFWKYCQSAREFKNSTMITVNYVDEGGAALSAPLTMRLAPTESKVIISPSIPGKYTRQVFVTASALGEQIINVTYKPIPENADTAEIERLLPNIAAWGDSITAGAKAEEVEAARKYGIDLVALGSELNGAPYPQVLENLISAYIYDGIKVANCGVGGEPTSTIAARADTESYYLTLGNDMTFTTGAQTITINQHSPEGINPGRIGILRKDRKEDIRIVTISDGTNTVTGRLDSKVSANIPSTESNKELYNCDAKYIEYTFTRNDGGTNAVNLSAGARITTQQSVAYDGRTLIIFMGENNGYSDVNTVNRRPENLWEQQKEILKACGNPEHFLIVSTTSKTTAERKELNDFMTEKWGRNYINMGNELSSRRAYEIAGYSDEVIATVADHIAEGSVDLDTMLLLGDACHPNAVGYAVIGNLLFERLFEIGAFDAVLDYYDSLNA